MKTFVYIAVAIIATILLVASITGRATSTELIRVTTPVPGALVRSPLIVSGQARGNWYFEASFPIRLFDSEGKELAVSVVQAQGEWMTTEFVPFEATLKFIIDKNAYSNRGFLILRKDNPSGLPEHDDALEIPIVFVEVSPKE